MTTPKPDPIDNILDKDFDVGVPGVRGSIPRELKQEIKALLQSATEKAEVNGMFKIVDLGSRGYHDRQDYPPYNPDPMTGRNEWNAYLIRIANEHLEGLKSGDNNENS